VLGIHAKKFRFFPLKPFIVAILFIENIPK
jgi:hypothetical protein